MTARENVGFHMFEAFAPKDRPAAMREELRTQRAAVQRETNPYAKARYEKNVATLEGLIDGAEARNRADAAADEQREAAAKEVQERFDAEIRDQLRTQYAVLSDAEFEERWPVIRDKYHADQNAQALSAARASGRYLI